jgi:hypothetical protein
MSEQLPEVNFTIQQQDAVSMMAAMIREQRLEGILQGLRLAGLLNEAPSYQPADGRAGLGPQFEVDCSLLPGDVILSGKPGGVGAKRKAALVDLIKNKRSGQPITKKYRPVGGNVVDPIETQLSASCLDERWV